MQLYTSSIDYRSRAKAEDVDLATKWWNDYPNTRYTNLARAQNTLDGYLRDVWSKPKRLARSASYTNLTYVKEAVHDYPIRRAASVSSLAPSLALPQYYREPERIVHTTVVYKPRMYDWYSKSYSHAKWADTFESLKKPLYKSYEPIRYSSYVPYYTLQTQRTFFKPRYPSSYIQESQKYLDKYVSARLKADDFAQHYAYTAYDWRRPQDHAFNRHFMYGEKVAVPIATRIPYSYTEAQALRRIYMLTGRFTFA
ncbi:unnamed protein product [Enterobius vermicularis]|uniref:SCP domain-containing protein n=1 Tax=Enterobius vermicularis TaxID=51028 RepID=A0A0N4V459_ENTVE|nr:unnamed protein product [Enterobius vermicularis]